MIIGITGSGGFIGKHLTSFFELKGNEVRRIPRLSEITAASEIARIISGMNVIINLAGKPIAGRWTKTYKKSLFDSRILTTRKIVEAINLLDVKPELLISASAIGIYSNEGEQFENNFKLADDYLGQICLAWESEAKKSNPLTRVAIIRLGIVLGKAGGFLKRLLPLFKFGLGGKIASGEQGFSWIHIADLSKAIQFIIDNKQLTGEFNLTAPEVVDNKRFTKTFASVLKRPSFLTVPAFALKILFGEGIIAVAGGQFAPPKRLMDEGFQFTFPELEGALMNIAVE